MVEGILNGVIIGMFGLTIGAVLQLAMLVSRGSEGELLRISREQRREIKKNGLRKFILESKSRREQTKKVMSAMPRSAKILMAAFYGLIAALIIIVKYGPLEIKWVVFIGSVFIGFIAMSGLYARAKSGKIRIERRSIFDVLPNERREKQT